LESFSLVSQNFFLNALVVALRQVFHVFTFLLIDTFEGLSNTCSIFLSFSFSLSLFPCEVTWIISFAWKNFLTKISLSNSPCGILSGISCSAKE